MENDQFSEDFIKLFMNQYFKEEKTKLSNEAARLTSKLFELFIKEAIGRSMMQCEIEMLDELDVDQLEKVLPQLLLDF